LLVAGRGRARYFLDVSHAGSRLSRVLLLVPTLLAACNQAPPEVTLDNFRTLFFEQQGGIAALHLTLSVEGNGRAEYRMEVGGDSRVQVKQLSAESLNELVSVLNRNQATTLSGTYSQSGADLFEETFRLVTDEATAEVRNQGDQAPRRYLNIREYLHQLIAREFGPVRLDLLGEGNRR